MRLGNDFEDGLAVHISNGELFSKSSRSDTRCSGMTRMIVGAVENVVEESLWVELVGGVCWWSLLVEAASKHQIKVAKL